MRQINRMIIAALFGVLYVAFTSCEEPDSEKAWGLAKVYMPQAGMQSGSNNNYQVPSGTNEFNKNYFVDNDNINVVLGVYRSGLQDLESFSVDVVVRPDTLNQLIADGVLTNAQALPEGAYTLPSTIVVGDGERESIFYLSVNRQKLLTDYPAFAGMRLALAVSITNPSKYVLNKSLSTTIVIINDWESIE